MGLHVTRARSRAAWGFVMRRCQGGRMALDLLGLRTVIHPVTDLAAATQWWTSLLGFGPYFEEPFYVGFEVAGYELGLLPGANPADGALTYWGVADCHAAMAAAIALGASVH